MIKNPYIEVKSRLKNEIFFIWKNNKYLYKNCIFNSINTNMKKIRWFTLLESLAVIAIIGIMSAALFNMRNVWRDYTDYRKEAANIIYKEIEQYLREFQRNKVRKDPQWNEHEIDSFQMIFADKIKENTRSSIEIWNTYVYCITWNIIKECIIDNSWNLTNDADLWSWYFESEVIISWWNFELKKNIKNIDEYKYYIIANNSWLNIWKRWEIYWWNNVEQHVTIIHEMVTTIDRPVDTEYNGDGGTLCVNRYNDCVNNTNLTPQEMQYIANQNQWWAIWGFFCRLIWIGCNWNSIDTNQYIQNRIKKCLWSHFDEICWQYIDQLSNVTLEYVDEEWWENTTNRTSTSFIISAKKDNNECENVWRITINSVAKSVSLDRCNNDREQNWIDCWPCE